MPVARSPEHARWMAFRQAAVKHPDAEVRRQRRHATTMRQRGHGSWLTWALKENALYHLLQARGYYEGKNGEHFDDHSEIIPSWAIPGLGVKLVETPEETQWMTWTDPEGYTIDCLIEHVYRRPPRPSYSQYAVFRLVSPGRVDFLGFHEGLANARAASGITPGRVPTWDERAAAKERIPPYDGRYAPA
jgi:hypothetical protein